MKQSEQLYNRMQKMLLGDKIANPKRISEVVKSDIYNLLSDYMQLERRELTVEFEVTEDGRYKLTVEAFSDRMKNTGIVY